MEMASLLIYSIKFRINSVFLNGEDTNPGEEESLPQIHDGHYFNVFNVFKIGGARYEYRVARKQSQMSNHSQGNIKSVTNVSNDYSKKKERHW
jgi:hypothetical protein